MTLPWTAPFASLPGGALLIDRDELELTVAGQSRTARLPWPGAGPAPDRRKADLAGAGVLVVRPLGGPAAHVVPLAVQEVR